MYLKLVGLLFSNTKWFRNSNIGHRWVSEYRSDIDGLDEYMLWDINKYIK